MEPRAATREASTVATAEETARQVEKRAVSPDTINGPPRLTRAGRPTARDLSSSIASNLASARGIPNPRQKRPSPISPLVSNQHADGHFSQDEANHNDESPATAQRPSWAPPLAQNEDSPRSKQSQVADAPFQQFYGTFESLMSKLSAPLAFAGLPLTAPAAAKAISPAQPAAKTNKATKATEPTPSVDYSQLISRAALRAVNSTGYPSNPAESFYVVPTTGGTTSYADIMNRADREDIRALRHHHRHTSNLSNITEDDFVDARSTVLPDHRTGTGDRRGTTNEPKVNGKTMEELALENETLRHVSDTLSRRLHVFEMSSQTSTAALAQSIRSLPRSPLATQETSRKANRSNTDKDPKSKSSAQGITPQIDEDRLAEILRKADARTQKQEEENAKLRETLGRYREKWDTLKAGAKARRDGQREQQGHPTRERSGDG